MIQARFRVQQRKSWRASGGHPCSRLRSTPRAAPFTSPTRRLAMARSIWLWCQGFVSNVENYWDEPDFARFLTRLGSYARVVTFDKRGTGMSDRVAELPGLEQRMDDLRAVMDAAGMAQASLLGISEGAPLAVLFAATYPDRCRALTLYGSFSRFSYWFPTDEALATFFGYVEQAWGTG